MNKMYVASLMGESLKLYTDILGLAPCRLFTNPFLFLSAPTEVADPEVLQSYEDGPSEYNIQPHIKVRFVTFENIFNPFTGISTLVTGAVILDFNGKPVGSSFNDWRKKELGITDESLRLDFVPYMELIPDAMRSRPVRAYSQAISNSLMKYTFDMTILVADPGVSSHEYLFKTYNSGVAEAFGTSNPYLT